MNILKRIYINFILNREAKKNGIRRRKAQKPKKPKIKWNS